MILHAVSGGQLVGHGDFGATWDTSVLTEIATKFQGVLGVTAKPVLYAALFVFLALALWNWISKIGR